MSGNVVDDRFKFRWGTAEDIEEILSLWTVAAENNGRPTDGQEMIRHLVARDPCDRAILAILDLLYALRRQFAVCARATKQ